jgi:hypothetical protein
MYSIHPATQWRKSIGDKAPSVKHVRDSMTKSRKKNDVQVWRYYGV